WVADYELKPKSVVREMVEQSMTFSELVSRYQLARSEGVVLRYLTDAYRALRQVVPAAARTEEVAAIIEWLGDLVRSVDSSLLDEWEALSAGAAAAAGAVAVPEEAAPTAVERRFGEGPDGSVAFTRNRHAFRVAVRNALFKRVDALAREAYVALGHLDGDDGWDAERWEGTMAPYWAEYDWLGAGPEARSAALVTILEQATDADLPDGVDAALGPRTWVARQTFDDPAGDHDWGLTALVDLDASDAAERAVVRVLTVGPR
ncbi:DUF3516 domain-containing protein, partial [Georgenia subflava]